MYGRPKKYERERESLLKFLLQNGQILNHIEQGNYKDRNKKRKIEKERNAEEIEIWWLDLRSSIHF